jgi:hypothetical protein
MIANPARAVTGIGDQFTNALNNIRKLVPLPVPVTRSFLFEIIDTNTSLIKESFSLVVPPTSVSVREPNRVSITKTFGNIFVDDYGADNIELVISGFSGTSIAFPTYQPTVSGDSEFSTRLTLNGVTLDASASLLGYTHKNAFYAFRDSIMRYKQHYDNFADMKLRVYDLFDEQVYDCILIEFSCDRNADRPLYYPYTIKLMAYNLPMADGDTLPEVLTTGGALDDLMNAIDAVTTFIDTAFALVQAVVNAAAIIKNTMKNLRASLATYYQQAKTAAASPLTIAKLLSDSLDELSAAVTFSYDNKQMTTEQYARAKETVQDGQRSARTIYAQSIKDSSTASRSQSISFDNGVNIPPVGTAVDANTGLPPTTRNSSVQSVKFSGVNLYTVSSSDTLQSIALKKLGDSALWVYVAVLNNLTSNDDLSANTMIYVPVISNSTKNATAKDQFIITSNSQRDPYGTDIMLDESGDIVAAESNDVATISGVANVQQVINTALNTEQGSIIKNTAFGLLSQSGGAGDDTTIKYMRMAITRCLMQDPRIKTVNNIEINVTGDQFIIGIDVTLIGSDTTIPVTAIV